MAGYCGAGATLGAGTESRSACAADPEDASAGGCDGAGGWLGAAGRSCRRVGGCTGGTGARGALAARPACCAAIRLAPPSAASGTALRGGCSRRVTPLGACRPARPGTTPAAPSADRRVWTRRRAVTGPGPRSASRSGSRSGRRGAAVAAPVGNRSGRPEPQPMSPDCRDRLSAARHRSLPTAARCPTAPRCPTARRTRLRRRAGRGASTGVGETPRSVVPGDSSPFAAVGAPSAPPSAPQPPTTRPRPAPPSAARSATRSVSAVATWPAPRSRPA